jgi:hypothetical protein
MTRDKRPLSAGSLLVVLVLGMGAGACASERAPKQERPGDAGAVTQPVSVLTRVDELVAARLPALKSADDVKRYLDELATQARHNGHVTALEVEPGISALQARQATIGAEQTLKLMLEFATRMNALSRELRGSAPSAPAH